MNLKFNKPLVGIFSSVLLILTSPFSVFATATTAFSESSDTVSKTANTDISWPSSPSIHGKSAILMDGDTGAILYSKKQDKKMYPASITKIMTAILTLENSKLTDKVKFSHNAIYSVPPSYAHLAIKENETLTVKNALYGLLLASANDVANGLAEHVSGSIDDFGKLMTQTATDLGCKNTKFVNPSGCHASDHYTTAYDMALITKKALSLPDFREISGTYTYTIPKNKLSKQARTIYNKHSMINPNNTFYDKRVICGKTGYTQEAGNTLVTCAKSKGMTLICVILNDNDGHIYPDTKTLLDYGFKNFTSLDLSSETRTFTQNADPITIPSGSKITVPKGVSLSDTSASMNDSGQLSYSYGTHLVGNINVIKVTPEATEDAVKANANQVVSENALSSNSNTSSTKTTRFIWKIFKFIFFTAIIVLILFILLMLRITHIRKKKQQETIRRRQERRKKLKEQDTDL